MPDVNIVNVMYEDRHNPGYFSGAVYSYIADHPVAVGDIVKVPTRYGDREAKVVKIGIPVNDIQCRVGQLLHITEPAIAGGDLFDAFLS